VPNSNISGSTANKLIWLLFFVMGVQLIVIGYTFYQSYEGRVNTVTNQRKGFERTKKDRKANAQGWRTAQTARMKTVAKEQHISMATVAKLLHQKPRPNEDSDLTAARKYDRIAYGLEQRSKITAEQAFPSARLFP
jgi:hypothetical protein